MLEDYELGGVTIRAGSIVVMLMYGSANQDETWRSRTIPVHRPDVHKYHMAFGGGVHLCLGAPLARLEGETALEIVLDRLPERPPGSRPQRLRGTSTTSSSASRTRSTSS